MMLSSFIAGVNLTINVDSFELSPQNHTIALKISYLISNKKPQTKTQ